MSTASDPSLEGRVLLLPATRRDGDAIRALLQRAHKDCFVCRDAAHAAAQLEAGAATLVLTDTALGDPGGHLVVEALVDQPAWSDLPVVLLGKPGTPTELQEIVRRLTNVTLLERPTSSPMLISAIGAGLRARYRQYQVRDQVKALQKAENELRQADRRKDEFLAMLAHELRNPLAPIRTASELLPRLVPRGDSAWTALLRWSAGQVGQLVRLVDDLLDVSRITQGRIELQRTTLDMTSIVAQALESMAPLIEERKHVLIRAHRHRGPVRRGRRHETGPVSSRTC